MKKILCCLLAVLLLLPLWSYAEPAAALTVSAVEGTPGENVELTLSLQNNPGIAGLAVSLQYDKSVLTLTGSKRGSLFSGFSAGKNFAWDESENVTEDGVLAAFTFAVSESAAAGEYPVQVVIRSCTNEDFDDVALTVIPGSITVASAAPEFTEISGTLREDVGLNFHTDTEAASVVFTWNGGDKTAEVTGTADSTGFRYTCPLSAKEMDAAVTAEIKDASGNTVDTFTYSMAEYLQSLTVANGYTQATETLAQATLDYGAAAKAYFLGGAEVHPTAVTEPLTTYFDKASMTTEDGGISYYGRSLLLKDVTILRLYFTAQSAPAVRVDGKAWEVKASSTAGYYMVDIPVGPALLGGSYAVTVDGTDIAFSVGVNDYIAMALEERAADDPLAELCRALYWYGAAAEAYAAE